MKNLFTLTLYDDADGYREGFFIGVFASRDAAENTAKTYLESVPGFKDHPCDYEIREKRVIGGTDSIKKVSMIQGWNRNDDMDEIDIWDGDLYADKNEAEAMLLTVQQEVSREEWCVDTYTIGECEWKEGFVRI